MYIFSNILVTILSINNILNICIKRVFSSKDEYCFLAFVGAD